ncbi:glucokinase [Sulfurimonas sp.]
MILAGDIGGTKINLALFSLKNKTLNLKFKHQFLSRDFKNFNDVIINFLALTSVKDITKASFAIAGPIINQTCKTTNLPWEISAKELQDEFNIQKVILLNDLEATAFGMLHLKENEFVNLNPNAVKTDANRGVIAAGTGLGEAMLYFDGLHYFPSASEGGHSDFAPNNEQQDKLLVWLRKRFSAHVSYERILSGLGIFTLYEFLVESNYAPQPNKITQAKEDEDKSALISQCAMQDNDKLCCETLRLFCEIYGAEAGNLALKTLSLGGIFIGGGIAPKILPFMQDGTFMNAFINKGRFKKLLQNMEVKISLNDETALLGAAHFINQD